MARKTESTEVLVQEEPGAIEMMTPEELAELEGLSGAGLEKVSTSDMALPFLTILQSNTPEAIKRNPEYVEGAEPGMIFNTLTKALYNELDFVASAYVTRYTEWKPRDSGGGLVRDWGEDGSMYDRCVEDERRRRITPTGTNIVKAATFFGQILPSMERAIIALSSTQLKKGRQWVSVSLNDKVLNPKTKTMFTPPLFYRAYHLSTVPESNEKGDWFGWKITQGKEVFKLEGGRSVFDEAKRIASDVTSKKLQVKVEQLQRVGGMGDGDDKIPF